MTDAGQDVLGLSVREFAAATAARQPTPGGGSVAGVVGALGAALGEMALNFTRGKKKYAEHESYYEHLGKRLQRARRMFQDLVADDVAAYQLYQATMRQEDGPGKQAAMATATAAAINVPREVTKLALALLADMQELAAKVNPWLITDLLASAALAVAAATLSDYNVRINIPNVADQAVGEELRQSSAADLAKAKAALAAIEEASKKHLP